MSFISLCMIAKNGAVLLDDCLSSIENHVDEIVVVMDGDSDDGCATVALKHGARVVCRLLDQDFAAQRNFSFSLASPEADWILWLDSDDWVDSVSASVIRKVADDYLDDENVDGFLIDYQYDPVTRHRRERLLRASKPWVWRYPIHEVCTLPQARLTHVAGIVVTHQAHLIPRDKDRRRERNIEIIRKVMDQYQDDPRMLFYAANEEMFNGLKDDAEKHYLRLLEVDEFKEQRCIACYRLSQIHAERNDPQGAIEWAAAAIDEDPTYAEAYCVIADLSAHFGDLDTAEAMFSAAIEIPIPDHSRLLVYNEPSYTWYPILGRSHVRQRKGDIEGAISDLRTLQGMELVESVRGLVDTLINQIEHPDEPKARDRFLPLDGIVDVAPVDIRPVELPEPKFTMHGPFNAGVQRPPVRIEIHPGYWGR